MLCRRLVLTVIMLQAIAVLGQDIQNNKCVLQIDTLTKLKVFTATEKMPEVQGGMEGLYKEVNKRLILPSSLKDVGEIKLVVAFIVKDDGSIIGKRVIKNVKGTDLAEQYLNTIGSMKWKPGTCNGKKVSVLMVLPMYIELEL